MQIKLPQEDQEERLNQQGTTNQTPIRPQEEQALPSQNKFKYIIYAAILIILIAALFMSSHQTLKVTDDEAQQPEQTQYSSKQIAPTPNQKKIKSQEVVKISKEPTEQNSEEFVIQKFGQEEQLKPIDWDQIKPIDIPKQGQNERSIKKRQEKIQDKEKPIKKPSAQPKPQNKAKQQPHPQPLPQKKTTVDIPQQILPQKKAAFQKQNNQLKPTPQEENKQKQSNVESSEKRLTIDQIRAQIQKNKKEQSLPTNKKDPSQKKANQQPHQTGQKSKDIKPTNKPHAEEVKHPELQKIINPKTKNTPQQKKQRQTQDNTQPDLKIVPKEIKKKEIQTPMKVERKEETKKADKNLKQLDKKPTIPQKLKEVVALQKKQEISQFKDSMSKSMVNPMRGAKFNIPKILWTFAQEFQQMTFSFYLKKCMQNKKYFAQKSQFKYNVLSSTNYKSFLTPESIKKIQYTMSALSTRQLQEPKGNLKDHISTIKQRLISLHILNQNGGIFVEKNVLLTQKLIWINDIAQNMYANKGNGKATPKYIAFYDIDHGSPLQKHNKSNIVYDTQRYMIQFPSVQPYFLAAIPKGQFLTQTLIQYLELLQKPETLDQKLKKYELNMGALQGKDLYYEALYISQHLVLKRKQLQINTSGNNKFDNNFAIDYFGLFAINQRYFPRKMQFTFENNHEQKVYWNLARYTLHELQETTGPLRYFVCLIFENHINYRLQKARNKQSRYYIHPQSFLSKYVINNPSQSYILTEIQKSVTNKEGKLWQNLPKIIWIYWDTGIQNSTIGNKLCVQNIKRYAEYSKFEVREVNNSNTQRLIGKVLNDKIEDYIKNKKITTFAQTKSDFVRIALIARYGGIYLDASYFSVEFFHWIVQISRYPSEFIFNRYGQLPKVLMHFHPHFGQPFEWIYDKEANTKRMWLTAYENNILIAEPNQELFWDWLEEYGRFITTPYEQTEQLMRKYGVYGNRWTSKDNVYLAAMDSIKNVIGKKELQIREQKKNDDYKGPNSAAQYYGIWSMSGYRGQQKFRAHTNFDNTHYGKPHNSDNPFLWRYSQNYVSGIIGSVKCLAKLYGWNIKYLNKVLQQSYKDRFQPEIHPISYFSKYLLLDRSQIVKYGDQLTLKISKK